MNAYKFLSLGAKAEGSTWGEVSGLEDTSQFEAGESEQRKAPEVGPRGRRQSVKYQSPRCRPSKESQIHTRPSKSVQRVWHHSRHRRGGNRRAWAGRNSLISTFSGTHCLQYGALR